MSTADVTLEVVFAATKNILNSPAALAAANNIASLFARSDVVDRFAPLRRREAVKDSGNSEASVLAMFSANDIFKEYAPDEEYEVAVESGDAKLERHLSDILEKVRNGRFDHYDKETNIGLFHILAKSDPNILTAWSRWTKLNKRPLFPDFLAKHNMLEGGSGLPLVSAMEKIFQIHYDANGKYNDLKNAIVDILSSKLSADFNPHDINASDVSDANVILNFFTEIVKAKTIVRDTFTRETGKDLDVIPSDPMVWSIGKAVRAVMDPNDLVNKPRHASTHFTHQSMDFLFVVAGVKMGNREHRTIHSSPHKYTSSCRGGASKTGADGYLDVGGDTDEAYAAMERLANELEK